MNEVTLPKDGLIYINTPAGNVVISDVSRKVVVYFEKVNFQSLTHEHGFTGELHLEYTVKG